MKSIIFVWSGILLTGNVGAAEQPERAIHVGELAHAKESLLALAKPGGKEIFVLSGGEEAALDLQRRIWATQGGKNRKFARVHVYPSRDALQGAVKNLVLKPTLLMTWTNYSCQTITRSDAPCTEKANSDGNNYWEKTVYYDFARTDCSYDGSTNTCTQVFAPIGKTTRYSNQNDCAGGHNPIYTSSVMGTYCSK